MDPSPNTDNPTRALRYTQGNSFLRVRPVVALDIIRDTDGGYQVGLWQEEGWANPTPCPMAAYALSMFVTTKYRGYEMLIHNADSALRFFLPTLEMMIEDGYEVQFTVDGEGRIIFAKITQHKNAWYIRDTFSLMPLPIAELRPLAGLPDDSSDVAVLLAAYNNFTTTMRDTFGIRPGVTIGSTAMRAFLTTLPEHHVHYRQRPAVERMARDAYFGGLVFVKTTREQYNVSKIDVNAMYAFAMLQGVPTRGGCYVREEYEGVPAIYACSVFCGPNVAFPFIPAREAEKGTVSYPKGQFQTTLPSNTIQLARKLGYAITVIDGYIFDQVEPIFADFVSECQKLENLYRGQGARQPIKMLRNSLYGKFGQRPLSKQYTLTNDPTEDMTDCLTWAGEYIEHLYWEEINVERAHMMPLWAAWITAEARNILVRAIYSLGTNNCIYGDTDSIIVRDDALLHADPSVFSIGTQYGEWKLEEQYTRFRAMGKKFYIGYSLHNGSVFVDLRHAGIPRDAFTAEEMETLLPAGPPVQTRPYQTQRRALNTVGGRPIEETVVKYVQVPELDAPWMHDV